MSCTPALLLLYSRHSQTDGIWIWLLGIGVGVYLFYRGFRLLARRRLIVNTPTARVRSAPIGLVELSGLAVGPYTMAAPITDKRCYYYHSIAWQLRKSGKNRNWEKVAEESLHLPFFLDDNTGRVLVDPTDAEMDLHCDFREEYRGFLGTSVEVPERVAAFLLKHGVSASESTKIEEFCIKPKNALFILGTLAENPGVQVTPNPVSNGVGNVHTFHLGQLGASISFGSASSEMITPREFAPIPQEIVQQMREPAPTSTGRLSQEGKIAAALMKAGITDPAAWEVAGISHANPSAALGIQAANSADDFDLKPKTVLMKGTHNPTFMISWRSQRDLLRSLGWKCTLMIWGGPCLTLVSLYILAAQLGWF